ncbi:MAG: SDR family oxidoreductase [Actinomycetes bacterium]
MTTALITGPTSGLGRQFALQLAAKGHNLVLVARNETRLEELALQLSTEHGTSCEVIPSDLSIASELAAVEARLEDSDRPIDWLINNAGFGLAQSFLASDVEEEQSVINVMVTAPMRLTHAALPDMIRRRSGHIIVVSSVASWTTNGTYSAAKAWATVFSEGVSVELKGTGVSITALCPGFVHTEFHERADMDVAGIPRQMWLDARNVVATALKDAEKGRVLSVPGLQYQALAPLLRLSPRALIRRVTTIP